MKTIRLITTVLLSILALTACNNDEEPLDTKPGDGNKIRITATVGDFTMKDGAPDTRISTNADGTGSFSDGDKILFYAGVEKNAAPDTHSSAYNTTLTHNGTSWSTPDLSWDDLKINDSNAEHYTFSGYYAFSIYGEAITPKENEVKFSVKTDQTGTGYFDSDLLIANAKYSVSDKPDDGVVPLDFKHAFSKINLELKSNNVTLNDVSVLLKDVKIGIELPLGAVSDKKYTTGVTADVTMVGGPFEFAAVIPPQTLTDGLKFDITIDGKTTTHTVKGTQGMELESGMVYDIVLTLTEGGAVGGINTATALIEAMKTGGPSADNPTLVTLGSNIILPAATSSTATLNGDAGYYKIDGGGHYWVGK